MEMLSLWDAPPEPEVMRNGVVNTAGGRDLEAEFAEFHAHNPQVYDELRTLALQLRARGRKAYGIKSLIEALRWHRAMETDDPDYKINNNWAPFYARMLMEREPELVDFFEVRMQTWRRQ